MQIFLIVLGAILAISGGVITEIVKIRMTERRNLKHFKSLLDDEIRQAVQVLVMILDTYDKTKRIYVQYLLKLFVYRAYYDRNKEYVILIKDKDIRDGIFNFYNKMAMLVVSIQMLPPPTSPNLQESFVEDQQGNLIEEFKGLKQLGESIISKMK